MDGGKIGEADAGLLPPAAQSMRELLAAGSAFLEGRDIQDAALDAWLLLEHVTGIGRAAYLADPGRALPQEQRARYQELLGKRGSHIPLQYLTGVQEFMGFPFRVNEQVLIPRQDTELLAERAISLLEKRGGARVLDLCTGSGCIAISLAKLCPGCRVEGADLSEAALSVAAENGRALGAEVSWIHSDLFEGLSGHYDLIVSNPPYIRTGDLSSLMEEVRLHEPREALDGHGDGLFFYRRIAEEAGDFLAPGGWLLLEIGWDQGPEVERLLRRQGFSEVRIRKDLAGLDRVAEGRLEAVRHGQSGICEGGTYV